MGIKATHGDCFYVGASSTTKPRVLAALGRKKEEEYLE